MAQAGTAAVLGGSLGGLLGALTNAVPGRPGTGIVAVQEDGRFAVALSGMFGVQPPLDDKGLQRFADALGVPLISEVVREATPSASRPGCGTRRATAGTPPRSVAARPAGAAPPSPRDPGVGRRPGRSARAVALKGTSAARDARRGPTRLTSSCCQCVA